MGCISTYDVEREAKRLGKFRTSDLLSALGVRSYAQKKATEAILRVLKRCGAIVMEKGVCRYVGNDDRNGRLINKICRAMHIKGVFSRGEIIKLSGVHKSTVRRAVIDLEKHGEIKSLGMERGQRGRDEGKYQICDVDGFYLRHVK